MITQELLVEVLRRTDEDGTAAMDQQTAQDVAARCLALFQSEGDRIRGEVLREAAERISPEQRDQVFGGAPWDMGFHDGKAVAAEALRVMARRY